MATIAGLVVEISARSQKFQKAMQGAQKRVDTLRRVTKEHSKRIEKSLRGAFESAASSVRGFAKQAAASLSKFAKQARAIAAQIGKWVAAGLTAAAAAVTAVVTTTSLAMRDLVRDSKAVGVAASDLQTWQYAARSMGIEADKVQDIMKDVNDKVGDFVRTGGGEAADIFEQLGINARDFIGLAPDQALLRISDALDGLSLGEKTFFMESLADDASRLLPLLDDNAKGLKAMGEQGREWGNIMTQAEIQASAALGATLTDAKNMAGGFKQLLGANLAPTFSALIGWIEDLAGEFGGPRKAAESMARGIVQAMIDTVEGIQSMIASLKDAYYWYVRIRELELNAQAALEAGQNFVTGGTETPAMDSLNSVRETRADLESGEGLGAGTISALQDLKERIGSAGSGIGAYTDANLNAAKSVTELSSSVDTLAQKFKPMINDDVEDVLDRAGPGSKIDADGVLRDAFGNALPSLQRELDAALKDQVNAFRSEQNLQAGLQAAAKTFIAGAAEASEKAWSFITPMSAKQIAGGESPFASASKKGLLATGDQDSAPARWSSVTAGGVMPTGSQSSVPAATGAAAAAAARGMAGQGGRMSGGKNLGTLTLKNDKGESQDFFTENTEAAEKWLANTLSGAASSV